MGEEASLENMVHLGLSFLSVFLSYTSSNFHHPGLNSLDKKLKRPMFRRMNLEGLCSSCGLLLCVFCTLQGRGFGFLFCSVFWYRALYLGRALKSDHTSGHRLPSGPAHRLLSTSETLPSCPLVVSTTVVTLLQMGQPRNKNNVNNPFDDFISEGSTGQSNQLGFHGLFTCAVRNY